MTRPLQLMPGHIGAVFGDRKEPLRFEPFAEDPAVDFPLNGAIQAEGCSRKGLREKTRGQLSVSPALKTAYLTGRVKG
jgi:hypothetical protein